MTARPAPLQHAVFVDTSLFDAVADEDHAEHDRAVTLFAELLDRYEDGGIVLITHTGAVTAAADPDRAAQLAQVCEVEKLDGAVRRPAARVIADHPELELSPAQATTLVLLRRRRIPAIATFDPLFARLDVDVL